MSSISDRAPDKLSIPAAVSNSRAPTRRVSLWPSNDFKDHEGGDGRTHVPVELLEQVARRHAGQMSEALGVIVELAETIEASLDESNPFAREIAEIIELSKQGLESTQTLMSFSDPDHSDDETLSLNDLARRVRTLLMKSAPEGFEIELRLADDLAKVRVRRALIRQALLNLGMNAIESHPSDAKIVISTSNVMLQEGAPNAPKLPGGRYVRVQVSDTGSGMDAEALAHAFDVSFTTKPSHAGLGLPMVGAIVEQHGGEASVVSKPGLGTLATFYLPVAASLNDLIKQATMAV